MKTTLFALILMLALPTTAQEILMDEIVEDEETRLPTGPGKDKFGHVYLAYGMITNFDEEAGAEINLGLSYCYSLGFRQKYKVFSHYSMGFDLAYYIQDYNIKQHDNKIFANTTEHTSERYISHNIGLEYFHRVNFIESGDNMGFFMDIGAYAALSFRNKHITKDKEPFANTNSNVRVVNNTNLDYDNFYQYGVRARLGFRKFSIFGDYRLSRLFNDEVPMYPDLPSIIIGLQIGLHR
jgi:hypothetical protein